MLKLLQDLAIAVGIAILAFAIVAGICAVVVLNLK